MPIDKHTMSEWLNDCVKHDRPLLRNHFHPLRSTETMLAQEALQKLPERYHNALVVEVELKELYQEHGFVGHLAITHDSKCAFVWVEDNAHDGE